MISRKSLQAGLAAGIIATGAPVAMADTPPLNAAIGAGLGAGLGAFLGKSMGGRDGALIGGALGAVAGVAIASQNRGPALAHAPAAPVMAPPVIHAPPVVHYPPTRVVYAPAQPVYGAPVYGTPVYGTPVYGTPVAVAQPVVVPGPRWHQRHHDHRDWHGHWAR